MKLVLKKLIKKIIPRTYLPFVRKVFFVIFPWKRHPEGKGYHEFGYWETRKKKEGKLQNNHYEYFYTSHFGLKKTDYQGKKILDIGCGPRGSLEWAIMAEERIGLDPLIDYYRRLGIKHHKMSYVKASSESIPFPSHYFDVVCSFNSLDHVDDLHKTIHEISRVTKTGGLFLLLTDVNHQPTPTEPISFTWEIVNEFQKAGFKILEEKHFEKNPTGLYTSINPGVKYNHRDLSNRYGILSAKFTRLS